MNLRKVAFACGTFLLSLALTAQEPVTQTDLYINLALPGYVQFKMNNPEAWVLATSLPLTIAGSFGAFSSADSTFMTSHFSNDLNLQFSSLLLELGSVTAQYSNYNAFQTVVFQRTDSLSLLQTVAAPFDPAVFLDARVAPFVLFRFLTGLSDGLTTWSYVRETKSNLTPLPQASLGAQALSAGSGFLAGYAEELIFHGLLQPGLIQGGMPEGAAVGVTAVVFSALHLTNMIFSPPKTERDWINYLSQAGTALVVGWYNGWLALDGPEGLKRAIAVHSWSNLLTAVSNGIESSDSQAPQNLIMPGWVGVEWKY